MVAKTKPDRTLERAQLRDRILDIVDHRRQ